MACDCGCGGEPRETDIQIGVKTPSGNAVPLGTHTPGHVYAKPSGGDEWIARHPGGQWVPLVPLISHG